MSRLFSKKTKSGAPVSRESSPGHLTPVVFHTLLALAGGPLHGYGISQEVEEASEGRIRMGPGTLYGSLQRMQKAGLLRPAETTEAGVAEGPHAHRRRYYALTEEGEKALREEAGRIHQIAELLRARALVEKS